MTMETELSSNWKKLQGKIKEESSVLPTAKRKLDLGAPSSGAKKQKRQSSVTRQSPRVGLDRKQKRIGMGGVQSLQKDSGLGVTKVASSALWAKDSDISPEDLADAYGIGVKGNSILGAGPDRVNEGLAENLELGKYVSLDCEMVGIGPGGFESSLARASIVDFHGRQVYDSYVRQREPVTDWRTPVSGIAPKHMRGAREFSEVQTQVENILRGRILVGHSINNDLKVLRLNHPLRDTRDTSNYQPFKQYGNGRKPALRVLARELLGIDIQSGAHSSIEDARVTMALFRKHKSGFDVENANKFPTHSTSKPLNRGGPKKKKSKNRKK